MRIRSKLVALIAVPLIALTLIAAFGFSNQSSVIETAETAEKTVARTQAAQNAVMAIGSERLHAAGGMTDSADRVRANTNASLTALAAVDGRSSQTARLAGTTTEMVRQARAADGAERSDLYGLALTGLLSVEIDNAADYPNASTRNTAVVNRSAVEALQLRELAWITYFQLDGRGQDLDRDAVASVIKSFAVADGTLRTTVNLADAGGSEEFNAVLQTNGAVELGRLETQALDDLNEGDRTVSPDTAIAGLLDYRIRWSETITEQGQALRAEVTGGLKDANELRSLFALLAILGSAVLAGLIFVLYRSITNPLEALLIRASAVADVELPQLVTALRNAEGSDSLPEPHPIPVKTGDEIGELVEAFNNVQITAYDLATEQALSRRNVTDMFVNLGRRNQQLLQRILGQLTQLEQHEEDPEKLAELFELDNIVTRMRRNAESLLALAGVQTARHWSQPVEMENTVRAAFGEVEGYERINVVQLAETKVAGRVVADITHLLAELLENALNFSDSQTTVDVNGHVTNDGYQITVTDKGIGMSQNELQENNSRITDPPPLDQVPTRFLGLYVVGRLAQRHNIEVRLTEAELNGTIARVLLPNAILSTELSQRAPDIDVINAVVKQPLDFESSDEDSDLHPPVEDSEPVVEDSEPVVEDSEPVEQTPVELPTRAKKGKDSLRDGGDDRSPLEETHDLEAELAALTGDIHEAEESPADAETASTDADDQPEASDWVGLPIRQKGNALDESPVPDVSKAAIERRAATETSAAAASNFSSMLSAFSSGINQGLEAAEDEEPTKGEDR